MPEYLQCLYSLLNLDSVDMYLLEPQFLHIEDYDHCGEYKLKCIEYQVMSLVCSNMEPSHVEYT